MPQRYNAVERVERRRRQATAATPTVGRNQPCPFGSGKKYKRCCGITTLREMPGGGA